MEEPYKRPDRAAIAARVEAEMAAERTGHPVPVDAFTAGGTGPDPLAVRELDDLGPPPEPEPEPRPKPPGRRCHRCTYRIGSAGHKAACGG